MIDTDPFTELHAAAARLAYRPLPQPWLTLEPDLEPIPSFGALYYTIRSPDMDRSDRAVRALVRLSTRDPLAATVLVAAVAGLLEKMIGRRVTRDYRHDALDDLTIVLLDPTEHGDLDHLDGLARRLARRAHTRAWQRHSTEKRRRHRHTHLIEAALPAGPADVESAAVDRAALGEFKRTVDRAIARGDLTPAAWRAYTDTRLRRHLGLAPITHDRSVIYRAAQRVHELVAHTP